MTLVWRKLFVIAATLSWWHTKAAARSDPVCMVIAGGFAVILAGVCHYYTQPCCWDTLQLDPLQLSEDLQNNVQGQNIAIDLVVRAVRGHVAQSNPNKPLVMLFQGTTGVGKNYVSAYIAKHMYSKYRSTGKSPYVKAIIGSHVYAESDRSVYSLKERLRNEILTTARTCDRSLFIIDEVDNMREGVIDAIHPFVGHNNEVNGVDFRKSIFLLLSSTGSTAITEYAFDYLKKKGGSRETMPTKEIEDVVRTATHDGKTRGLGKSRLIVDSLIDFYVPFLPLERDHIEQCIRVEFLKQGQVPSGTLVKAVWDTMPTIHIPGCEEHFIYPGCKQVKIRVAAILDTEYKLR